MTNSAETWTTIGLLDHVQNVDKRMEERAFAFILGAGASKPADIPTSTELVHQWLQELQRRLDPQYSTNNLEQWATAANLDIPGFEFSKAAAFYSQVFERRFRDDPNEGYAYLNDIIKDKEPSIGYLILAQLINKTRHRIVITTNFDNLISEAMGVYSRTYPLAATPTALSKLARPRLRQPILAKIHQDPLSASDEQPINNTAWAQPLYRLFEYYTPIVIGYDEDDGGVIDLLNQIEPCDANGGIFWCYQEDKGQPNGRVEEIVNHRRGKFVPIPSFDQFMLQLAEEFSFPSVAEEIETQARDAVQRYRQSDNSNSAVKPTGEATTSSANNSSQISSPKEHTTKMEKPSTTEKETESEPARPEPTQAKPSATKETNQSSPTQLENSSSNITPLPIANNPAAIAPAQKQQTIEETITKAAVTNIPAPEKGDTPVELDWNSWVTKLENAADIDEKESLYKEAVEAYPNNATLFGNFAYFMETELNEPEKAEALYRQALKLDSKQLININRFANFMAYVRKSYDAAERLYQRAIELNPELGSSYVNYAGYLILINNLPKALEYTKKAWSLNHASENLTSMLTAYYRALIALATRTDPTQALGRLKTLLEADVERQPWNPKPITLAMKYKLIPEKHAMVEAIAEAISIETNASKLEQYADWTNIKTIPLSQAWND